MRQHSSQQYRAYRHHIDVPVFVSGQPIDPFIHQQTSVASFPFPRQSSTYFVQHANVRPERHHITNTSGARPNQLYPTRNLSLKNVSCHDGFLGSKPGNGQDQLSHKSLHSPEQGHTCIDGTNRRFPISAAPIVMPSKSYAASPASVAALACQKSLSTTSCGVSIKRNPELPIKLSNNTACSSERTKAAIPQEYALNRESVLTHNSPTVSNERAVMAGASLPISVESPETIGSTSSSDSDVVMLDHFVSSCLDRASVDHVVGFDHDFETEVIQSSSDSDTSAQISSTETFVDERLEKTSCAVDCKKKSTTAKHPHVKSSPKKCPLIPSTGAGVSVGGQILEDDINVFKSSLNDYCKPVSIPGHSCVEYVIASGLSERKPALIRSDLENPLKTKNDVHLESSKRQFDEKAQSMESHKNNDVKQLNIDYKACKFNVVTDNSRGLKDEGFTCVMEVSRLAPENNGGFVLAAAQPAEGTSEALLVPNRCVEDHQAVEEAIEFSNIHNHGEEACKLTAETARSSNVPLLEEAQMSVATECELKCDMNLTNKASIEKENSSADSMHGFQVSDREDRLTANVLGEEDGTKSISGFTSSDEAIVVASVEVFAKSDDSPVSRPSAACANNIITQGGKASSDEVTGKAPVNFKISLAQKDKLRKALLLACTLSNSSVVVDELSGATEKPEIQNCAEFEASGHLKTQVQSCSGEEEQYRDDSADMNDLPAVSFIEPSSFSREYNCPLSAVRSRKPVASSILTLDDILEEKRKQNQEESEQREERKQLVTVAVSSNSSICESVESSDSVDFVKPEHQKILDKISVPTCDVPDIHPGEPLFNGLLYLNLFSYPETLSLSSCGFTAGTSRTDKQLASLSGVSISEDADIRSRLQRILYNVLHSSTCNWVPTVLSLCRVLVNFGSTLSQLSSNLAILSFSHDDLKFAQNCVNGYHEVLNGTGLHNEFNHGNNGFRIKNLMSVIQIVTDAIAVRPESYSSDDCLALTMIMLRVSLEPHLAQKGQLQLSFGLFFAAVLNAIPHEHWLSWVRQLCDMILALTSHHHNMVYLIELFPLVERGVYLRRVLSYVFLQKLSHCNIENIFVPKVTVNFCNATQTNLCPSVPETIDLKDKSLKYCQVKSSLTLLKAMSMAENDYYLLLSVTRLLGYSIGSDNISENEREDFKDLINLLHLRISKLSHLALNIGQSVYRTQAVMIATRWDFMYRRLLSETMFSSPMKVGRLVKEKVGPDNEASSDISDD